MAASKIEIINFALTTIGEERILSEDDRSRRAEVALGEYDMIRRALLRRFQFNFSIKRVEIAEAATAPEFGYTTKYLLPSDFIRVVEEETEYLHKVEGRYIVTDATGPLPLVYVADIQDASMFDDSFARVLAYELAYHIVESLTQSNTKRQEVAERLRQARVEAGMIDATENSSEELPDTYWVEIRR